MCTDIICKYYCSPKDDLEFSIVRENIREKLKVSSIFLLINLNSWLQVEEHLFSRIFVNAKTYLS